jgi:hypothetical protein
MLNVHVASRPVFHALSNGGLVFAVSLILSTGKWRQHFTEALLAFNLHFQHICRTGLTGKPNASFERALNFGLETALRLYIYFIFVHSFCP